MNSPQVLLPADDHQRPADQLCALDHDITPLLWSRDGVTLPDGGEQLTGILWELQAASRH